MPAGKVSTMETITFSAASSLVRSIQINKTIKYRAKLKKYLTEIYYVKEHTVIC